MIQPDYNPHLMDDVERLGIVVEGNLPTLLSNIPPDRVSITLKALKILEEVSGRAGRSDVMAGIRLIRLALAASRLPPLTGNVLSSLNSLTYKELKPLQTQVKVATVPVLFLRQVAETMGQLDREGSCISLIKQGKLIGKTIGSIVKPFKTDELTQKLVKEFRSDKKDYISIALMVSVLGIGVTKAFGLDTLVLLLQVVVLMLGVIKVYSAVESPETDLASLKSLIRSCFDRQFSEFEARSEPFGGPIVRELEFQRNQFYEHLKDANQEFYVHEVLQTYLNVFLPSIATPKEIVEVRALLDKSAQLKERAERDIAEFKDRLQRCCDLLQERIEGGGGDTQLVPFTQFELRQQLQEAQELQNRLWMTEKAFPSQVDPIRRMPTSERLAAFAQIQRIESRLSSG